MMLRYQYVERIRIMQATGMNNYGCDVVYCNLWVEKGYLLPAPLLEEDGW